MYWLLLIHDLVTCYVGKNNNQVPQTGVVSASNLASTYGLGNYGTYGTYSSAALNGALYGSSLPFLPSVFYRTRTRLAATEEGENTTSSNQGTVPEMAKVSKDN